MSEEQERLFEKSYQSYSTTLYRIAVLMSLKKSDAEDCVADTFVKLIKCNKTFDTSEHEKAWLIRVCQNICRNKRRQLYRGATTSLDYVVCFDAENPLERVELLDCLSHLSEKENIAIYLQHYEGYSQKEIATMLGLSHAAVRAMISRALKKLQIKM